MKPVLVYLSGPITPRDGYTVADNVQVAVEFFIECIKHGIPAFAPQLGAQFPQAFEVPYETWMAYDFAIIDRCTHVLMLPRWETSNGAKREKDYAFLKGLPTFYALEDLIAHASRP